MSEKDESRIAEQVRHQVSRLFAPDALRGLIIVFMALDHANLFVAHKHSPGEIWDGVFPVYYDVLAFLTRLVTHLAAPGFFFLMGAGMLLFAHSRQKHDWGRWAIMRHFLIRGGVLIALQLLVVNRAWELPPEGWEIKIYFGVLCALGSTMILGSLLLWLKPAYLLVLAAILFVGIELTHPGLGMWGTVSHDPVSVILLRPGGDVNLWAYYSILPWLELVVFGMVFGHWLADDPRKAFSRAWKLGLACLLAFVVVRYLDGFGNIRPRMSNSWIDFLNPVKYPPSMTFTLMTTGVNLLLLWLFSRASERVQRFLQPLAVFGRTPLFFYVLHLFLYAGIGYALAPDGTSIPVMYPFWLLGLLILFPLCLWYGRLKHRQPVNSVLHFL
ncbi:MAG: DUF1624 domain-containing protein [Anaerolineae bacterium]|nr:MAG: DUF1624 domain-containing protein [Anaerolineae bacterium]